MPPCFDSHLNSGNTSRIISALSTTYFQYLCMLVTLNNQAAPHINSSWNTKSITFLNCKFNFWILMPSGNYENKQVFISIFCSLYHAVTKIAIERADPTSNAWIIRDTDLRIERPIPGKENNKRSNKFRTYFRWKRNKLKYLRCSPEKKIGVLRINRLEEWKKLLAPLQS